MSRDVQGNLPGMGFSIRIGEPSSMGPRDSRVWRTPGGKQAFSDGFPSTTSRRTDRVRTKSNRTGQFREHPVRSQVEVAWRRESFLQSVRRCFVGMRNGLALDLDRSVSIYPSLDVIPDSCLLRNLGLVGQPQLSSAF